jgi:hypothetical protein
MRGLPRSRQPTIDISSLHKLSFVGSVVFPDVTPHSILPSADKRQRVGGIEVSTEGGLICPTFHDQKSSCLWIIHCGVIGYVSDTLSRGDGKHFKVTKKLRQVRGLKVHVPGYYEHDIFLLLSAPDRRSAADQGLG